MTQEERESSVDAQTKHIQKMAIELGLTDGEATLAMRVHLQMMDAFMKAIGSYPGNSERGAHVMLAAHAMTLSTLDRYTKECGL